MPGSGSRGHRERTRSSGIFDAMDKDRLKELWHRTLPDDVDWEKLSGEKTYRSGAIPTRIELSEGSNEPTLVQRSVPRDSSRLVSDGVKFEGLGAAAAAAGFRIVEEIARGGMGIVFRAHQDTIGRDVAVKQIIPTRVSEKARTRFLTEGRVTGFLDHPNIVPVHELGETEDGQLFLAMKLVGGRSWKQLLRDQRKVGDASSLARNLEVLIAVCNAISFAHSKGLCHLDLKPENVMVGNFGEVLVMDWGLTVSITPEPVADSRTIHRSSINAPLGTPAYMPPELVAGDGERIGPWTDVFLLGAVLHELLTGKPPHQGEGMLNVLLAASRARPKTFPTGVPGELGAICNRAMAKDPGGRYATVDEFRHAIEAYRTHDQSHRIAADAHAAFDRSRPLAGELQLGDGRQGERNRLYGQLAEVVAGFHQALVLWPENERAEEGEHSARRFYAETALRCGDLGLAAAQAAKINSGDPGDDQLRERIGRAFGERHRAEENVRVLRRTLLVAVVLIAAGLVVGLLVINRARHRAERSERDAQTSARLAEVARGTAEARLAQSLTSQGDLLGRDGRWDEARSRMNEARSILTRLGRSTLGPELGLFAAAQQAPPPWLERELHPQGVAAIGFCRNRRTMVTGGRDGLVLELELDTLRTVRTLRPGGAPITGLAVARERSFAAWVDETGAVTVTHLRPGSAPVTFNVGDPVQTLALRYDGTRVLVATGSEVRLYDAATGDIVNRYEDTQGTTCIGFSPNGDFFAHGDEQGRVRWWHLESTRPRDWIEPHDGPVRSVAFSSAGGVVVSGGDDQRLVRWSLDPRAEEPVVTRPAHTSAIAALTFQPFGRGLISVARDGALIRWTVQELPVQAVG
ncbi:MAG: protein kinase domain-containing protein, partial [Planctomycetota bacterium]